MPAYPFKGKLDPVSGRLTDMSAGKPGAGQVSLAAMPNAVGEWGYDSVNKLAVPLVSVNLAAAKAGKNLAIDNRTIALLELGFVYGGKTLSMSPTAMSKWRWFKDERASFSYPFPVNNIDDTNTLSVADADTVVLVCNAGMIRYATIMQGDAGLKQAVNACTTIQQVNAIADNRA